MIVTIDRVDLLHHEERRFDDGSIECYRVRGFRDGSIVWTGLGFETRATAHAFLDGLLCGLRLAQDSPVKFTRSEAR